jgi:hypothetical protein
MVLLRLQSIIFYQRLHVFFAALRLGYKKREYISRRTNNVIALYESEKNRDTRRSFFRHAKQVLRQDRRYTGKQTFLSVLPGHPSYSEANARITAQTPKNMKIIVD